MDLGTLNLSLHFFFLFPLVLFISALSLAMDIMGLSFSHVMIYFTSYAGRLILGY